MIDRDLREEDRAPIRADISSTGPLEPGSCFEGDA